MRNYNLSFRICCVRSVIHLTKYFVFSQTTLSFVVLDKDTNAIKMIKDERGDFMGSCNLSLTEVSLKCN